MDRRRWLAAIPALAAAAVVVVLLGPGKTQARTFARARATYSADGGVRSLRVETLARGEDRDRPAAVEDLRVVVAAGAERKVAYEGRSDAAGIAEIRLDPPAFPGERLVIEAGGVEVGARTLAPRDEERLAVVEQLGGVGGTREGALGIRVALARGVLAVPFEEEVRIAVEGATGGEVLVTTESAEPAEARLPLDARGEARLAVRALGANVGLVVEAREGERTGRFSGRLPAVMGAVWLDPTSKPGALRLVAAAPKERVFASFLTREGRVGGAAIGLEAGPDGRHRAELAAPTELVGVRLATDASELGQSTVVWPAPGRAGLVTGPRLTTVLDGGALVDAREAKRLLRVRLVVGLVVMLAAAIEIALFLELSRRRARTLDARLRAVDPTAAPIEGSYGGRTAAFAILVAVAFAAIAATALYPR